MRVGKDAARFAQSLVAMGGVTQPRVVDAGGDGEIEFGLAKAAGEDVLDQVAKKALDGGFGLRELAPKTKTLEEVFFQLTK
jgi:hypothetical protein